MKVDGAQVNIAMMSLAGLVRQAYGLSTVAFSGPEWMSGERYDIRAKLPSGSTGAQVPAMLRNLLAERFKLAFHYHREERHVYALVVGKNGLRMKEADPAASAAAEKPDSFRGTLHLERAMTMPALCDFLGGFLDKPAVDLTGLTAAYQVALDIPFEEVDRAKRAADGGRTGGDSAPDPPGGSAFVNVVRQLGLKLEPRRLSIEVLVVDHAEKLPAEN